MDFVLLLFGPPILVAVMLAPLPAGRPFLIGLGCFAALWALLAFSIFPVAPASGPDDWYAGIETVPFFIGLAVAAAISLAQGLRWWRKRNGKKPRYILILIGVGILSFIASIFVGAI